MFREGEGIFRKVTKPFLWSLRKLIFKVFSVINSEGQFYFY